MEINKTLTNSKDAIDGLGEVRGYIYFPENTDDHMHNYGSLYRLMVPRSGNSNSNLAPIPKSLVILSYFLFEIIVTKPISPMNSNIASMAVSIYMISPKEKHQNGH